ncbi:MAG: hypothetical protein OFPII_22750 [Osedax symbiont Rs1]|nr:MAG: hypothetical protein OFPII_22750 [Osedax symbiont Rs1]
MLHNSFILLSILLAALSVFIPLIRRYSWHTEKLQLYQRITTWWYIIAVILLAGFNLWSLYTLTAVVICCCLYELAKINQLQLSWRWLLPVLLCLALQWCIAWQAWILLLLVTSLLIAALYWLSSTILRAKKRLLLIAASASWILGLSAISAILSASPMLTGIGNLLFLVVICQGNDVAQYCWGKSLGGKQISPTLSPNKTWAGFLGGLSTLSVIGFWLGPLLTQLSAFEAALGAALICLFGFFGDLSVSALKRFYKIKDTGTMLPGHGGMGDRVDSLLLSSWLFYFFLF